MPLNKGLREFLELLNSNGVEYLVVGAFAVAFHGFPRYTADLDLLVRPAGGNAARLWSATKSEPDAPKTWAMRRSCESGPVTRRINGGLATGVRKAEN